MRFDRIHQSRIDAAEAAYGLTYDLSHGCVKACVKCCLVPGREAERHLRLALCHRRGRFFFYCRIYITP